MNGRTAAPRITAAVCVHNEARTLRDVVESLLDQTYTHQEVLVVDNGSTDGSVPILARLESSGDPRFRVVREPIPGLSRARNLALRRTRSPLVAFIDADAVAEPDWLETLVSAFDAHPGAGVVGGSVRIQWDHPRPGWWRPELDGALGRFRPSDRPMTLSYPRYPYGSNFAIRRRALADLADGFAHELGRRGSGLLAAEEGDLCLRLERAGWEIRFAPEAVIRHRTSADRLRRRHLLRRAFHNGRSQSLLERRNGFYSGIYPCWRGIAKSVIRKGVRLGWDLPFLRSLAFRVGYRWQQGRRDLTAP